MAEWLLVHLTEDGDAARAEVDRRWQSSRGRCAADALPSVAIGPRTRLLTWHRPEREFPGAGALIAGGDWRHAIAGIVRRGTNGALAACTDAERLAEQLRAADGEYAIAAADVTSAAGGFAVTADAVGHVSVFEVRTPQWTAYTTAAPLLADWITQRRVAPEVLDLFVRTGELLDDLTLMPEVRVLEPGVALDDRGGTARHFELHFRPDAGPSLADWADRWLTALRDAVQRCAAPFASAGIPLSGGLDSRLLTALATPHDTRHTFTWGLPGCPDRTIAARVAAAFGTQHHDLDLDAARFADRWNDAVVTTGGTYGIADAYMVAFTDILAASCDGILNGLAGDIMLGGNFTRREWRHATDLGPVADLTWSWRTSDAVHAHADRLVAPDRAGAELWRQSILRRSGGRPAERIEEWLNANRVFRWTNLATTIIRTRLESASPFYERDALEMYLTTPLDLRRDHRLYLAVLQRLGGPAASITWDRPGIPPRWGHRAAIASRAVRRVTRAVRRRLPVGTPPPPVADQAGWFRRGPWRAPMEAILLSERCLDRGLVDADATRAVIDDHLQGQDLSRLLGRLIALELWARHAFDQETAS